MTTQVTKRTNVKPKTDEAVKPAENEKEQTVPTPENEKEQKGPKRFGPYRIKKEDQMWSRAVLMTCVLIIVIVIRWKKPGILTWVSTGETLHVRKVHPVHCANSFLEEIGKFPGCTLKQCGRVVADGMVSSEQVDLLVGAFHRGLKHGGSSGGASILDLHTGALSKGEQFINPYKVLGKDVWTEAELNAYKDAKERVKLAIADSFNVRRDAIHLTSPTFFSEMTARSAKTVHDEYWHPHVDKETYETFHFTALLYLSDYGTDFNGGRFVFVDNDRLNRTVEPRKGRVLMFTSGPENLHFVEKVTAGHRYALTIAFTCDSTKAISDP